MSTDFTLPDLAELLEHQDFVLRLARRLVVDEHRADDLAQEVWVTALQRPPTGVHSMRAWLTRVAQRLAMNAARGDERRRGREAERARETPSEAAGAEFELQHMVASKVRKLDEPYRTTILLCYFKQLSHGEIAKEMGVSIATVRSRIYRGHAKLREELDRESGGDREAWSAGLVAMLGKDFGSAVGASGLATGVAMGLLWKIGLGVAAVFLALWWGGLVGGQADGGDTPVSVEVALSPEAMSLPAMESGVAVEAEARDEIEVAAVASAAAQTEDEAKGRIRIHGRVLFPSGEPAAGLAVELKDLRASGRSETEFGTTTSTVPEFVRPEDWVDSATTTGADGGFELHVDPPLGCEFDIVMSPPGLHRETWQVIPPEGEAVEDFGVIYLRGEGSLAGRVIDQDGAATGVEWEITALPIGSQRGRSSDEPTHIGEFDISTGAFLIEGLPEGIVDVIAGSSSGAYLKLEHVPIVAGEVAECELVFKGPDPSRTISVSYSPEMYYILHADPKVVRVQGQGYDSATDTTGKQDGLDFHDLDPGLYTVTIDDERLKLFVQNNVSPGERVRARPLAASGARLVVTDASTGAPIEAVHVRVRLDDYPDSHPDIFELHELGPLGDDGLLPPLVPGHSTLLIEAAGYTELEVPLMELVRGEVRDVAAELRAGASVAGRVLDAGAARPGTQVLLMPAGARPALPQKGLFGADGYVAPVAAAVTDEAGRYSFAGLAAGTYDLYAARTPWLCAESLGLSLAADEPRDVDLELPGGAQLEVHITGLGDLPQDMYALFIRPEGEAKLDNTFADRNGELASVAGLILADEDGVWRGAHLPSGSASLELYRVLHIERFGIPSLVPADRAVPLGSVKLAAGEVAEAHFDLAPSAPGTVTVELRVEGAVVPDLDVKLISLAPKPEGEALVLYTTGSGGTTDADGLAVIEGVFPGTYRASYRHEDYSVVTSQVDVQLAPGGSATIRLDYHAIAGELRLLDQDGAPLGRFNKPMKSATFEHDVTFDKDGYAKTTLAPGEYEVSPWRRPDVVWRFTWPEQPSGVVEARLEPRE